MEKFYQAHESTEADLVIPNQYIRQEEYKFQNFHGLESLDITNLYIYIRSPD